MATNRTKTRKFADKHIQRAKLCAKRYFDTNLSDEQAVSVLESNPDLADELDEDGHMDTAPRDYFGIALIELLMPGVPPIGDGLICGGGQLPCWHWPCNGSSEDYTRAFREAWSKATSQ